ncbi:MAG: hypothetical protein H5T72_03940 [Actinobacteria bacterium]|nr:hypothetical protein [Actinomycetota bacterium]
MKAGKNDEYCVRGGEIHKSALAFSLALLFAVMALVPGCGGDSIAALLERSDDSIQEFEKAITQADHCLHALLGFNFENASFLDEALSAVRSGMDSLQPAGHAVDVLSSTDYRGKLAHLGELVSGFVVDARSALEELSLVYHDLESILMAIEPLLLKEAVITQMEVPQDQAEWRGRLLDLRQALETTLQALAALTVGPAMTDYHSYFTDVSVALKKVVDQIISRLPLVDLEADIGISADFSRILEMLDSYPMVVERLKESISIFSLDPVISEIEVEINDLYMESNSSR